MAIRSWLLIGIGLVSLSCSDLGLGMDGVMNSSVNGTTVMHHIGKTFDLELDVHATVGYQWDCRIDDSTVVHLDSTSFRPKNKEIVEGGLTVETFHFRAINTGTCSIELTEHRQWETGVPPINSLQFQVRVF